MLDSEESDKNVDDNDGATSSSSRLASGTLHVLVVGWRVGRFNQLTAHMRDVCYFRWWVLLQQLVLDVLELHKQAKNLL